MRYAIISDIHGNLEGLNTVMEHAKSNGVDKFVCGGDVVGYNANPKECMDIVRGLDTVSNTHLTLPTTPYV